MTECCKSAISSKMLTSFKIALKILDYAQSQHPPSGTGGHKKFLIQSCVSFHQRCISLFILKQASVMGDDVIVTKCLDLIDRNGRATLASPSFAELRQEIVKRVISRDTLNVPTEDHYLS